MIGPERISARLTAIQSRIADINARFATPPAPAAFEDLFAKAYERQRDTRAATAAAGPTQWDDMLTREALNNRLDPRLLRAVMIAESGGDPNAISTAGAQGLMQLMPGTAAGLGVTEPFDPAQSIAGGARYMRAMLDRFGGDVRRAIAAYNAGPGAVESYGGVPPYDETQGYVDRVLDLAGLDALR